MKTHESAENYLETIFILNNRGNKVRSIDIVNELGLSKPSVSIAMKKLREKDYIAIDNSGHITLTESGKKIAETMYERHLIISDVLISIGVDKETAIYDACKIEHCISEQTFLAIKNFTNK
ncbi:MAG: metal-dependent transcriptional regulator [Lachnospiraceae bacterium]|nr:metal-dependent transcriptional regulator [Lachnospiraceae bacterium]